MRPRRGVTPAQIVVTVLGSSAMATDMVIAAIAETCARAAGTFRRHRHGDFPTRDLRTGVSALRFTYERGPTERKSAV